MMTSKEKREQIFDEIIIKINNIFNNKFKPVFTIIAVITSIIGVVVTLIQYPIIGIIILSIFTLLSIIIIIIILNKKKKIKIYCDRDKATPIMKNDIRDYKHIAFIGISHSSLATYLQDAINESKSEKLPWETILVIFANQKIGESWEGNMFQYNLNRSKIKITSCLFSEENQKLLKDFKEINYRQSKHSSNLNGCFCSNSPLEDVSKIELIYSVNNFDYTNSSTS